MYLNNTPNSCKGVIMISISVGWVEIKITGWTRSISKTLSGFYMPRQSMVFSVDLPLVTKRFGQWSYNIIYVSTITLPISRAEFIQRNYVWGPSFSKCSCTYPHLGYICICSFYTYSVFFIITKF